MSLLDKKNRPHESKSSSLPRREKSVSLFWFCFFLFVDKREKTNIKYIFFNKKRGELVLNKLSALFIILLTYSSISGISQIVFLQLFLSSKNNIVQIAIQISAAATQYQIAPFQPNLSTTIPVPVAENIAPI